MSTSSKLKQQADEERKAFKSFEGRKKKERHIRLTNDMLMHEKYLSLTCTARVLYNYMKLWSYGSHDYKTKGTFEYTVTLAMKVCGVSNKTAIKAFYELENGGFIERQNNSKASRSNTIWAFSDKWHKE